MHTIKDLQDHFGDWSYMQARKRVNWLSDHFNSEVKGGSGRKYLITDNGFKILDRLHQLEQDKLDLTSAFNQVKGEFKDTQEDRSRTGNDKQLKEAKHSAKPDKLNLKYVEQLEQDVKDLKDDKRRLQEKVDDLEQRLLPPPSGSRSNIFARFTKWLLG